MISRLPWLGELTFGGHQRAQRIKVRPRNIAAIKCIGRKLKIMATQSLRKRTLFRQT
jgi:hypothetical protein